MYKLNVKERKNKKKSVLKECNKCKRNIFTLGIVIGLVIGTTVSLPLINIYNFLNGNLVYLQYTKYVQETEIVYTNEDLQVSIEHNFKHGYDIYKAYWINIHGETDDSFSWHRDKETTLGAVLNHAVELSENQLLWFEYMLRCVV